MFNDTVFLSYSSKDSDVAESVCSVLETDGIKCWMAPRNIQPGMDYASAIISGLKASQLLVVVFSKDSNNSPHVLREIERAVNLGIPIIPFKIDPTNPSGAFEYFLSTPHWLEAITRPLISHIHTLRQTIRHIQKTLPNHKNQGISLTQKKEKNRLELEKKTRLERLSFGLSLDKYENGAVDHDHRYNSIKRFDVLDSEKGIYSSHRWICIQNLKSTPTYKIAHTESGENRIHFDSMKVRARVKDMDGDYLRVDSTTLIQPSFMQNFEIFFLKPLEPFEEIQIYYRLSWPGEPISYTIKEHSQSISFTRYKHGVKMLEFGVFEPCPISSIRCIEITQEYEEVMNTTEFEQKHADNLVELSPIHGKSFSGFTYVFDSIEAVAYRFLYHVDCKKNISDEDDFF